MKKRRLVFDVESIGLHGEGWAVGYVLLLDGDTIDEGWAYCPPSRAVGTQAGRDWIDEHCPWGAKGLAAAVRQEHGLPPGRRLLTPAEVRDWFWRVWREQRDQGAELWADVPWPVEVRFLVACIEDDRYWSQHAREALNQARSPGEPVNLPESERTPQGPYPLFDVRSFVESVLVMTADRDPVEASDDDSDGVAVLAHHPLVDARLSATKLLRVERLLSTALR